MFKNKKILITSGPTIEKIDPVRYISNFSSGKQGFAFANEFAKLGAIVTLVSGPSLELPLYDNIKKIYVESAQDMLDECLNSLPVDIAICCAAVCDYRPFYSPEKIKKINNQEEMSLRLIKNPDILKLISTHINRPKFVVGFAAETNNVENNAYLKLTEKKCDLIVANNVNEGKVFGSDLNQVTIISKNEKHCYEISDKNQVAINVIKHIKL